MRNFLLIGTCLLGLCSTSLAADAVVRPAPRLVATADPFTGWFIGANVGYDWSKTDTDLGSLGFRPDGFLFGGDLTYRSAINNTGVYLGLTSSLDWTIGDDRISPFPGLGIKVEPRWLGATQVQVGYRFLSDLLVYAQGGVAYGSKKATISGFGTSLSTTEDGVGWALGAGADYNLGALAPGWLASVSYTHYDLGKSNYGFNLGGGITLGTKADSTEDVVKVGVKYKFGT